MIKPYCYSLNGDGPSEVWVSSTGGICSKCKCRFIGVHFHKTKKRVIIPCGGPSESWTQ